MLVLPADDLLWFVDQAVDAMAGIVGQLGDSVANTRPDLDGANSPYAILYHCLGVMEYWGGHMIAGRSIERDRDAEFDAHGLVAELLERTTAAKRRLAGDIAGFDSSAPPRDIPMYPEDAELPFGRSQGGVLVHIFEEVSQHLGQMELTRDLLLASARGQGD